MVDVGEMAASAGVAGIVVIGVTVAADPVGSVSYGSDIVKCFGPRAFVAFCAPVEVVVFAEWA